MANASDNRPATRNASLRASLGDGAAWSLTVGFWETFLSPFAVALGAANIFVGLIATLPQVAGDLAQIATPTLVRCFRSRKRLVLSGVALQACVLVAAMGIPFLSAHRISALLAASVTYWVAWMTITPAWQSWMGDLVPPESRGAFFALRGRVVQLVTFASLLAGGLILEFSGQSAARSGKFSGFIVLIALGALGRFLSLLFIGLQQDVPEPGPGDPQAAETSTFRDFVISLSSHNFGRFVIYVSLFGFAVNLSGSYFVPYVLRELGFSYLRLMILLGTLVTSKFLTLRLWGELSDRYGNRKLLGLACFFFCLPPLLVAASGNFYYLILVQIPAGLAIGGFELCSFNFLLDATEPAQRTRAAAYYQVISGLGIVSGALLGGLLLKFGPWPEQAYLTVFLLSGGLRMVLAALFLPMIREVRDVPHVSYRQLLSRLVRFQKSIVE